MAVSAHPRKVSSPKSFTSEDPKFFDQDEPLMVGTVSDASTGTGSTKFDDEPLMIALPCYDFLKGEKKEFEKGFVFASGHISSDDERSPTMENVDVSKHLEAENRRLEEENAYLRLQYQSFLQMAQQGYMPMATPGFPTWAQAAQAQMVMNGPPGLPQTQTCKAAPAPQAKVSNPQQKGKQQRRSVTEVDDAEADCSRSGSDADAVRPVPRTSVMLRNLPNSYTRQLLMKLLDDEGFEGKYDFVYLPIDFKTKLSLAYAFINLVNAEEAKRFWSHFNGFSDWAVPSHKIASVNWSEFQGLARHIERYRSSPVMHEGVPDEYKPVLLSGGERIHFPAAAEKVRAPRCRVRSKAIKPGRVA